MPSATAPAAALPVCGDIIAGKYSLLRRIGEGGMGVVFEAMHLRLRVRVAIKILRPDVTGPAEVLARFEREARITAQLRSGQLAVISGVSTKTCSCIRVAPRVVVSTGPRTVATCASACTPASVLPDPCGSTFSPVTRPMAEASVP